MAQIPPIDDAYIDEIIKAAEAYNTNLNKTQGVKLRELIKRMRDRSEQQNTLALGSTLESVTENGNTTNNAIQVTGIDNMDPNIDGVVLGYAGSVLLGNVTSGVTTSKVVLDDSSAGMSWADGALDIHQLTGAAAGMAIAKFSSPSNHAGIRVSGLTGVNADEFTTKGYTDATYAPNTSPALGGIPTAATAATGTNTTQLATTAYVFAAILSKVISGVVFTTNAAITAADTLLTALGKLQAQINARLSGTLSTDAETQISTSVAEDNKFVSRLKLFNWWSWVKNTAAQWTLGFLSGTSTRMIQVDSTGQVSASNTITDGFVTNPVVIAAITGATYNSGNSYTTNIAPSGAFFYQGQMYKSGQYLYIAILDNTSFRLTGG